MGVSNFNTIDLTGTITQATATEGNLKATSITTAGITNTGTASATYVLGSVATDLTAAGTTRADALQLAAESNNLTTVAASTGVILPVGVIGMKIMIINNGASTVQVYASASETIDGTAGATGVTLANAKDALYTYYKANTWASILYN